MHRVTLLLGGNRGDMPSALHRAVELLGERVGVVVASSQIYRSEAWGFHAEEPFSNQAVIVETTLEPTALLYATQSIEAELGRDREKEFREKSSTGERYCSRTMDIDIMFYDAEVISTPRLTIPHPLMQQREFALEPMCELEGGREHPVLKKTLNDLWSELRKSL